MNLHKTTIGAIGVAMLSMSVLAACGDKGDPASTPGPSGAAASQKPEPPAEISIFVTQNSGTENLTSDNPVLKEIEKRTNTKLNITWVPTNSFAEKSKVTLASGDLTDLFMTGSAYDATVVNMATAGAFWDITPYIKDYPNLKALPDDVWKNVTVRGKIHGIPRIRPLDGAGSMPMIRKDWLDKLNLKMPETMEELYEAAKAFTERDPDGNGKADTVGIVGDVGPDAMGNLAFVEQVFTGTPGILKLQDGKLTMTFMDPGMKQSLEWLNRAYKEKVLAEDFAVLKNSQSRDIFMGNKAGMMGSAVNPQWLFTSALRKIVPEGDIYPLPYLVGPNGKFAPKDVGNLGVFLIPKTVPESKLKKILALMDFGISEEGANLAIYGIKDVHYKEEDGFKVATEQAKTDLVGQNYLGQIFSNYDKYQRAFLTGIPKDLYERNKQVIDQRAEISVADPGYGLISQTWLTVGPDLMKKIQDLKIKVIMGKEPMSAWDDFVAKAKTDAQWTKVIAEFNEAYQAR